MTQISDAPTATEVSGPSAYSAAAAALPRGALRAAAASGGAEWTGAAGWSQTTTAAAAMRRGNYAQLIRFISFLHLLQAEFLRGTATSGMGPILF